MNSGSYIPAPPSQREQAPPSEGIGDFASDFLDANLAFPEGSISSLKETLAETFVFPIAREAQLVRRGLPLSSDTPMLKPLLVRPAPQRPSFPRL